MVITLRDVVSASEHRWSAALWDGAALHTARCWTVRVVDRMGGGDSFAAALIFAFQTWRTGLDALEFATAASALKLTIPGDFNRVSAAEVDRLLDSPPA